MSKVAPHNAWIEYANGNSGPYVVKWFREGGKFTAGQEARAYDVLRRLLDDVPGARAASILALDEAANTLSLEFIEGLSLHERLAQGEFDILEETRERLLRIFIGARDNGFFFDSDPSNILFEAGATDGQNLVFIDPSCITLPIRDHAFIVFMWGLIKILLRDWRVWHIWKMRPYWDSLWRGYCALSNVSGASLAQQMVAYIDLVIRWNKERNPVEGPITYSFRRLVVIPIYRAVRLWFLWNSMSR